MEILFLSQLLPYPPDAGPKVRSYYTLRYLCQKHQVRLLAFRREDDSAEAVEHLRGYCSQVDTILLKRIWMRDIGSLLRSLAVGKPFVIQRDKNPEMHRMVAKAAQIGRIAAVHADQLWMAQYASGAHALPQRVNRILDEHNACYQVFLQLAAGERSLFRRLVLEREWRALKRYEARKLAQFDRVVTVTQQDRTTLERLEANSNRQPENYKYHVIPICVDTQNLTPVIPNEGGQDVLHLGTMFWLPNVEGVTWFIREVWPLVKSRIPLAQFTVVGRRPPEALMRMAEGDPSIHFTGYVADPSPDLRNCTAFIVPLLSGSGMRVKIIEAWGRGLAVVSTSIGAEGLKFQDQENILIADGAQAFAVATIRLLEDQMLNRKLRENGRRWCEQHYDWRNVYQQWDQVYPEDSHKSL